MAGSSKAIGNVGRDVIFNESTHQAAERVTSCFQLPMAVPGFAGRKDEIAKIKAALTSEADAVTVTISAVAGMAGVGKSALAIYVAHELTDHFEDAQLYVNLRGADAQPKDPYAVLGEWLQALGLQGNEIPEGLAARKKAYRSQLANKRALVVLDNAVDAVQVKPLLPGGAGCGVLVTSRQTLGALPPGTRDILLQTLLPVDALELLENLAGEERMTAAPEAAIEIVRLCGYLPIAVAIAGGVLKVKGHWALGEYLARLENEKERLGALAQAGGEDVRASFNLSYELLSAEDARLFALLGGGVAGEFGIGVAAAVAELEGQTAREGVERLIEAQLIEALGGGRYRYHDLLRLYAQAQLSEDEVIQAEERAFGWYHQGASYFDNAFSPKRLRRLVTSQNKGIKNEAAEQAFVQQSLDWYEVERANLLAAFDWGYGHEKWADVIAFAASLTSFFQARSYWDHWVSSHEKALVAARQSENKQGASQTLNNLGLVYQAQGRWDDAIAQYKQSLEIKRTLGDRHGEGTTLNNLGNVYQAQGRWDDAIAQYEQSLEICRTLGDRHGEGQTLNNLGLVYQDQGRWDDAIAQYEQSLEICRTLGDRHGEGQTLNNLGLVYQDQGRWDDAIAQYEQSLEIKRTLGDRHGEGQTLNNLGLVYQDQGRWDDAIAQYKQSLEICRTLGDRHSEGQTLGNLGNVYQAQGRWDDAIAQCQQSLEIFRTLGDRHGEGQTLMNLGNLHQARIQPNKANEYWQAALIKLHPDSPAAKRLTEQLNNPFKAIKSKQFLIGCLPQLALLAFAAINLFRGHWPIALAIFLAWVSFLTYRIWRTRRGR